ncbi:hypothetical protein C0583_00420 [Candidatus Parcubacteria bacterium]|nr:MAG: hypothetical protein C0583_00420 [Candidatus Parcubacteria bacterium]
MNSKIYTAKLKHKRIKPKENSFEYNAYMFYLDLDDLDDLDKELKFFSKNKFNLFSFYDKDHFRFIEMEKSQRDVIMQEKIILNRESYRDLNTRERIRKMIRSLNLGFEPDKIFLLTSLRILGYVFNPVSFYYVFDSSKKLRVLVSEVHNTFYDQKMFYSEIQDKGQKIFEAKQDKNFYISPFTSLDNKLHWRFNNPGKEMIMMIDSMKNGELELATSLVGEEKNLNNKNLFILFLRYPLYTLMVMIRIHLQALKLWLKKTPFNSKVESDKYLIDKIKNKKV